LFDLINFGGDGYRVQNRGVGRNTGPIGNPEAITEIAVILDGNEEFSFPLDEVRKGEREGYYTYFGYRTVGNIVEYRYRWTG